MDWHRFLIEDDERLRELLRTSRRIAVLGIKPESRADRPAHYVARYLADVGYEIIPVPVYYPDVQEILGHSVYPTKRSRECLTQLLWAVVALRRILLQALADDCRQSRRYPTV